jgi:3D (Asp-Asp-Asp) domain-containing protein
MVFMSDLLYELEFNEVIGAEAVLRLRSYISSKSLHLSASLKASIFADAIIRAVDEKIPLFSSEYKEKLKAAIFGDAVRKPVFAIDCCDIFKASIQLRTISYDFLKELHIWLVKVLKKTFSKERLFDFVINAHNMMDKNPNWDISQIVSSVENEMGGLLQNEMGVTIAEIDARPFIKTPSRLRFPFGLKFPARACIVSGFAAAILTVYFAADAFIPIFSGSIKQSESPEELFQTGKPAFETVLNTYTSPDGNVAVGMRSGSIRMRATAYDLSYESCGKLPGDPGYGITNLGTSAATGRTIAVDPKVIPLGSRVYISFSDDYDSMNGIYIAEDTGRLIMGNSVDIFFGEDRIGSRIVNDSAMKFGIRYVDVRILD